MMLLIGRSCMGAALLCAPAFAGAAGLSVPAGAHVSLNGGSAALAGQDLRIDGALALGSGSLFGLDALRTGAGAQADLGSGLVELSGDWENRGTLVAGTSQVRLLDGQADSAILGSTTFASLALVSSSGKRYHFESGLTQTVSGQLTVQGASGLPIQVDVTQPGSTAFLDLLPSGTQAIAHVGVSDVHASGQPLAPTLSNEGGRGNDQGWFGNGGGPGPGAAVPAPTLSPAALFLFALAIGLAALRARRRVSGDDTP
jgi:hypothetical protein